MDAKYFARAAVGEPDWWQEPSTIDFDALRTHVAAAIEAAVQAERTRCARLAWEVYQANPDRPGTSEYHAGQRAAAVHIARRIEIGKD